MARYDPSIINLYAEELYHRAEINVAVSTIAGILLGLVNGYVIGHGWGALVAAAGFGYFGFSVGEGKASELRLQAQVALCQVQIEQNTRQLASAIPQLLPSPSNHSTPFRQPQNASLSDGRENLVSPPEPAREDRWGPEDDAREASQRDKAKTEALAMLNAMSERSHGGKCVVCGQKIGAFDGALRLIVDDCSFSGSLHGHCYDQSVFSPLDVLGATVAEG